MIFLGWHLRCLIIDAPELGKKWYFDCNRWLDARKEDRLIERELELTDVQEYQPKQRKASAASPRRATSKNTVYIAHVETSDIQFAGTDAKVYLQIFGENNSETGKIQLQQSKNAQEPV